MADLKDVAKSAKKKRYTGKLKWLDPLGVGYIVPDFCGDFDDDIEVFVSPSSLSSHKLKEGDCVRFSTIIRDSNPPHFVEAIIVVPSGVLCSHCSNYGHDSWVCPQNKLLRVKCYRCGLSGHYARDCDQKLRGWFSNGAHSRDSSVYRRCNGWLSLFGETCRFSDGGGNRVFGSVVCVRNKKDVKKAEEVHDCFILDFDPTPDDDDDDEEEEEEEIIRSIVCVKKEEDVKKIEEVEDCFILEFDPTEPIKFSKLSVSENSKLVVDDYKDVSILAEKGQVACRDYPHPRHLCATHPFKKTPHENPCTMCYCYICDIPAPCKKWKLGLSGLNHCDATDDIPFWRMNRDQEKRRYG